MELPETLEGGVTLLVLHPAGSDGIDKKKHRAVRAGVNVNVAMTFWTVWPVPRFETPTRRTPADTLLSVKM